MTTDHAIPEPYAAHLRAKQQELEALAAQRNKALATAYEVGQRMQILEHHISELLNLQVKAGNLPQQDYRLTEDLHLVPMEQKVNGVAHGG